MHEFIWWALAFLISAGFSLRVYSKLPMDFSALEGMILLWMYWIGFFAFALSRLIFSGFIKQAIGRFLTF